MERLGVAAAEAGVEMLGGDRQVGVAVMHGQAQQRPPLTQGAKQRAVRQQRAEAFVDQHPRHALAGHQAHQRVERHRALGERCARHAGLRRGDAARRGQGWPTALFRRAAQAFGQAARRRLAERPA